MRPPGRLRREHKKAPSEKQRGFGFAAECVGKRVVVEGELYCIPIPNFEAPNPLTMTINGRRLTEYLAGVGQDWVEELVRLLLWSDWSLLVSSYKPTGRPPIHPRVILGLVVYGLLLGRTSLRELEMLAQVDLGAWLVCGGLQPDHSTIGKFLNRHASALTEAFFEQITSALVQRLQLKPGLAAIDGTVVAAASSRLSTLKLEAAREAAKAAAAVASAVAEAEAARRQVPGAPAVSETTIASNSEAANASAPVAAEVAHGTGAESAMSESQASAEPVPVSSPEIEAANASAPVAAEVAHGAGPESAMSEPQASAEPVPVSSPEVEAANASAPVAAEVAHGAGPESAMSEPQASAEPVPVSSPEVEAANASAPVAAEVAHGAGPESAMSEPQASAEPVPVSSPEVEAAKEIAAAAAEVVRVAEARAAKAEHPGRMAVVPGELDAVIQPLKNGANHPSYKPSVIVHESGLILGKQVDPSSETAVVPELRAQHRRILGADPTTSLFDAGYCCLEILRIYAEEDILCPAGTMGDNLQKRGCKGLYAKAAFTYDESADLYRCPQGKELARRGRNVDREGRAFVTYKAKCADCTGCPVKERCTKANTRTVSRYEGDELKEAMAQVMAQPSARAVFRRRAPIVEPTFAFLKEHQGLKRFRRRSLTKVRLEFSLHCLAFNIGRGLSLQRRSVVVFVLLARIQGGAWRVIATALAAA